MINASQEFKNLINSGVKIVNYADITLRDGTVLNLTPEDFALGGFSMTDEMTDGKFGVGYAVGKTIDVTIANHTNKFSSYDFYKSIIYMYVAVELEDGRILKERKGKYYVINPTSPGDTIKISGVDSMYLLDKPYEAGTVFPATLQDILSDCCIDCGINIGFGEFDRWNFVVDHKPEDATYRDVISYVAQIAGCNARINNNDAMELVWYDVSFMNTDILDGGNLIQYDESDTYDGGDFSNYSNAVLFDGGNFTDPTPENVTKVKSLSVSTDEIIITGVKLENDDVEILKGTDDYVIHVKDNPLVSGKEEEIALYLYNKLKGYKFRALSCNIANNPLFESYDACYVYDRKGNAYFTLVNSVQYKISGFTTISCKADDPVRNESSYTNEAAKALVKAKRNTEMQFSTYDKAVQNMNMLASNAMGLYRESEKQPDGSEIYYQSNRPIIKDDSGKCIFEENAVVYKMTADGFFVSTDGGESFVSGFDSNGNAIVNVLSAIGITFDWAKGGTISLGGENNQNGRLLIFDANNKQVGQIDNAGLAFYSDTTKTQFILSPIFGLIQRDANGNEYNGFIHDVLVRVDKSTLPDLTYEYEIACTNYCDVSLHSSITIGDYMTSTYRKYKYTATSHRQYWSVKSMTRNTNKEYIDIVLPEKFHGKDWLVLLIFDGWKTDISNYSYVQIDKYGIERDVNIYDGQSWVDNYYAFYESNVYPATGPDSYLGTKTLYAIDYANNKETKLESYGDHNSSGNIVSGAKSKVISHMTPTLSKEEMNPACNSTIEKDITASVVENYNSALSNNKLVKPELSYEVLDREKTTLRVYCEAAYGLFNIAHMASIRVIVSA